MRRLSRIHLASCAAGAAVTLSSAVSTAAPTALGVALTLRPGTVHAGNVVRIRGSARGCQVGNSVFVISRTFPRVHEFAGVPAVLGKVGASSKFRAGTRIPSRRLPGRYSVSVRCGGGNLGISRTLTVVR